MSYTEMLSMFFVHDGGDTSKWRLKGHSVKAFWEWVASWAVMLSNPSDIGYDSSRFDLPQLNINEAVVDKSGYIVKHAETLQERRSARKDSLNDRVKYAADLVNSLNEPCIVWCDLNTESDMLTKMIDGAVEVKGSQSNEHKENAMTAFSNGEIRTLVTKPSIAGFGMNWQHCSKMVFVGLSDSFEQYYQAVRRCWRFGQTNSVDVWVVTSEKEGAVVKNIKRKEADFERMLKGMIAATQEINSSEIHMTNQDECEYRTEKSEGTGWELYNGDCVESIKQIPDNHVHYTIFSPPFSSLYTYSNSIRDMGNCKDDDEFYQHFGYLAHELLRILKPGRLMSVHCMNLPTSKQRDGVIGIKDFRGDLIRIFEKAGFIYHSEVCIWKDPVVAMQRTKALGLLHKQIKKDSAMCRQGIPDYLVTFRKPGENVERIEHTNESFPVYEWQKYASPIWMDINPSNTLQKTSAREDDDERHICPLQLDVIRRALDLWTNPDDIVFTPFAGIGSECFEAVRSGRRAIGIELKWSYFVQATKNLQRAEREAKAPKQVTFASFGDEL
jgi:DNA modification methylase